MPGFKIPPTQEDGTPWKEPSFAESLPGLLYVLLPYGHPYKQCKIEELRIQMASRLEGYFAFVDTHPFTSKAEIWALPFNASPSKETMEKARNESIQRRKSILTQDEQWRNECDKVFNWSIYKNN